MAAEIKDFTKKVEGIVIQRLETGNRQEPEAHPEKIHEEQGQPEGGGGEADKDQNRGDPVKERTAMRRRIDADRDGGGEDDDDRQEVNADGDRQPFDNLVQDRATILGKGVTEVEDGQSGPATHHTESPAVYQGHTGRASDHAVRC